MFPAAGAVRRQGIFYVYGILFLGDGDAYAVDLDAAVGGDEDVAPSVDNAGADEGAVLRVDLHRHLRGADLEVLGVDDVHGGKLRVLSELLAALLGEAPGALGAHAAALEDVRDLVHGNAQLFRVLALAVQLDTLGELLVDGLHDAVAALLLKRGAESLAERLALADGGHGDVGPEHGVNELLVYDLGAAGVEERGVDIRGAVVKGGEHEAQLRRGDDLVDGAGVEAVLVRAEAQRGLARLHRAYAAEYVAEHAVAVLDVLPVLSAVGDVVVVVREENEIVRVLHVERADDAFVELVPQCRVLKLRAPESGEEPVFVAVHDLLRGKGYLHETAPQRAGERLAQESQILLALLLAHKPHGLVHIGDYLLGSVDVAAVDVPYGAAFRAYAAADLAKFLAVHALPAPS